MPKLGLTSAKFTVTYQWTENFGVSIDLLVLYELWLVQKMTQGCPNPNKVDLRYVCISFKAERLLIPETSVTGRDRLELVVWQLESGFPHRVASRKFD